MFSERAGGARPRAIRYHTGASLPPSRARTRLTAMNNGCLAFAVVRNWLFCAVGTIPAIGTAIHNTARWPPWPSGTPPPRSRWGTPRSSAPAGTLKPNDLLAGIGTERARALTGPNVDLDDAAASPPHVAAWRSGTPLGGQGPGQIAISVVYRIARDPFASFWTFWVKFSRGFPRRGTGYTFGVGGPRPVPGRRQRW